MPTLPVTHVFYAGMDRFIRLKYADGTLSEKYKVKDLDTIAPMIDDTTWLVIKQAFRLTEAWIEVK